MTRRSVEFEIGILGPFQFLRDGQSIDIARMQRRQQSLLRLLAATPQHSLRREQVIDSFWPEASEEAGGSNLRYVIHILRRSIRDAPPAVELRQGQVSLNPSCNWCIDIDELQRLLDPKVPGDQELDRAARLYRGEALPEERYEDWAEPARARAKALWRRLCTLMVSRHETRSALDEAISWQERLLEAEPLDEENFASLVRLLMRTGRRGEALHRYRVFSQHLESELGTGPLPETDRLITALISASEHGIVANEGSFSVEPLETAEQSPSVDAEPVWDIRVSYSLPDTPRVIGRDEALAELELRVRTAPKEAAPTLVSIEAEAGAGKTWLLGAMAARAREEGVTVLAAAFYEREGLLPLGGLREALLDFLRLGPERLPDLPVDIVIDLLPIMPELRESWQLSKDVDAVADPSLQRLRLFLAVARLLSWIAKRRQLLLILDDLHWGDEQTHQLLHFLMRNAEASPFLVAVSFRPEEAGAALIELVTALGGNGRACRLPLKRLAPDHLADLVADRLGGDLDSELVQALHSRSLGNPLFALQIVRLLQERTELQRSGGVWHLSPDARVDLPDEVRRVILRRLNHLPETTQRALALGSILGERFPYAVLEKMWTDSPENLLAAMDVALGSYVVQETGDDYVFRHPLLREVIYDSVALQRRRSLHRLAGAAIESTGSSRTAGDLARLSYHFTTSGLDARKSLTYSMLSAEQADAVAAHSDAARNYNNALANARILEDKEAEAIALERLGTTRRSMGEVDDALAVLESAADIHRELTDITAEVRVTAEISLIHHFRHTWDDGLPRVLDLLSRFRSLPSWQQLPVSDCILHNSLARLYLSSAEDRERTQKGLSAAGRSVQLAKDLDEPSATTRAWLLYGWALCNSERYEEALPALSQSVVLSLGSGHLLEAVAAENIRALSQLGLGRPGEAGDSWATGFRLAVRRGGIDQLLAGVAYDALETLTDIGRWNEVMDLSAEGLQLAKTLRHELLATQIFPWRATVHAYRGEFTAAATDLELNLEALDGASIPEQQVCFPPYLLARGRLALLRRRRREVRRVLDEWEDRRLAENSSYWLLKASYLREAHETHLAAETVLRVGESEGNPLKVYVLADALCLKGCLELDQGRHRVAERTLLQALRKARHAGYRLAEARILMARASILIDRNAHGRGQRLLAKADSIFGELGAKPFLHESRSLRARFGLRTADGTDAIEPRFTKQ